MITAHRFVLATVAALAPSTAVAQPLPTSTPIPAAPEVKSPAIAALLSLGLTTAGVAALAIALEQDDVSWPLWTAGGVLVAAGPSAGHLYAGELLGPAITVNVRSLGLLVAGVAKLYTYDSCVQLTPCEDEDHPTAEAVMYVGLGVVAGVAIYDLIDAPRAARRANRRAAAFQIAPTALPSTSGIAPGLALTGSF